MASLAHIANGELGLSVRNKLNSLIDQYNVPVAFPSGGGTTGSVLFIDSTGAVAQDNAKFFWDDAADILKLLGTLALSGTTSGTVTLAPQAVAGTWTLKLPNSAGTNLYVLQTDGTGVTSWVPQSGGGGMAIGGSIAGATLGSVLFAGAAGVLAQDNANFFWDDTNFNLKIDASGTGQGAYYVGGKPAIFRVANVAGDNWFEDNAGNFTTTGHLNFGTGDGALSLLTTGFENTALGAAALGSCTSGSANTAIGTNAAGNLTTSAGNFAIGANSLLNLVTGTNNLAIGASTLHAQNGGNQVVGVGSLAWQRLVGNDCVGIGHQVGQAFTSGQANTIIGPYGAFNITSGSFNTLIGAWEGPSASVSRVIALTDGDDVTFGTGKITGVDYNYTTSQVWSYQYKTNSIGLHIYNTTDSGAPPANYERAILDWNVTANVFRLASQKGGTGTVRLIAIDGFQKAGAPAAGDLPSGTWGVINDTSGGQTWLVYNNAGTIRKVQLT